MQANFKAAFEGFVAGAQAKVAAQYGADANPKITYEAGRKFVRIVSETHGSRSAFCFVEIETGDVLKCAGWKAPAKGKRGNIFNPDNGMTAISAYGAVYFR